MKKRFFNFNLRTLHTEVRAKKTAILVAAIALVLIMVYAITTGNYRIPVKDVFEVISSKIMGRDATDNTNYVIVWEVRLPRILLSALGGMALSMSGAVFQGVFQNPLVEPYILGVSSGAAFGAAVSIVFLGSTFPISTLAFVFALVAMIFSYSVATKSKQTPLINLILSGVVVSSLFTALLNLLKVISSDGKLREIAFWTMGGFYVAKWEDIAIMLPLVVVCLLLLRMVAWKLNVLTMGEEEAQAMGVSVGLLKILTLGVATLATSTTVSLVGIVSWVGLMIPHASRMLIGSDHRFLIPFSAFTGAIFLVICDTIARSIIFGELPISIITSVLGAPYIIYLLRKNRQVAFG